jgi:hypothetical protein
VTAEGFSAYATRPAPRKRTKLASFFGRALGKDPETHSIQTVLAVCLDDQVVEAALRVHPQAWRDGENLKQKVLGNPRRWSSSAYCCRHYRLSST